MWGRMGAKALPPPSNHLGVSGGRAGYSLKVYRSGPGTLAAGTRQPDSLFKEPGPVRLARPDGPGLLYRILPVHVIKNVSKRVLSIHVV